MMKTGHWAQRQHPPQSDARFTPASEHIKLLLNIITVSQYAFLVVRQVCKAKYLAAGNSANICRTGHIEFCPDSLSAADCSRVQAEMLQWRIGDWELGTCSTFRVLRV